MSMGQAILQYLGNVNSPTKREELTGVSLKGKETTPIEQRRPEDCYDLEDVCRAAGEVSENAQGMLSYKWGPLVPNPGQKRGATLIQTTSGEFSNLAKKLESLEESQALEKDKLDVVNKQWGVKLESIEGLMKTLLSQHSERPSENFVQQVGQGNRGENSNHEQGKLFKPLPSTSEVICFGCGKNGHFQSNCERIKALLLKGALIRNHEGRICLPDGSRVPNIPMGACLADRVERYYASITPSQTYYGAFEEMEDQMGGVSPRGHLYVNQEVDNREQKIAKLEKEFELKERENTLLAKQKKLESKISENSDVRSFLLEHFDEELKALQENKSGFH